MRPKPKDAKHPSTGGGLGPYELMYTERAQGHLDALAKDPARQGIYRQVVKALRNLRTNPKHPSLRTHAYDDPQLTAAAGTKVFEAYAQNKTSGAYRIFWCYGPGKDQMTILAITEHP